MPNIDFSALGIELSDEQLEQLNSSLESELDKARSQASKTARKNAEKELKEQLAADAAANAEAMAEARAKEILKDLTKTEDEKLDDERKQLEADRQALETDRKRLAVESKFKAAGYDAEQFNKYVDLFAVGKDVTECETSVDSFLENINSQIAAKVDEAKAALTNGGTPPATGKDGQPNTSVKNEAKLLSDVYAQATVEGFDNTIRNNADLDLQAVLALDALTQETI